MNRPAQVLTSWAISDPACGPCGDGVTSVGEDGTVSLADFGSISSHGRSLWIGWSLLIGFVLLAPWGGYCERRSRPADPTTLRLAMTREFSNAWQAGICDPAQDSGRSETDLAILDDEDRQEDTEGRGLPGSIQETAPPAPRLLSFRDTDDRRGDSGRSARSRIRRC